MYTGLLSHSSSLLLNQLLLFSQNEPQSFPFSTVSNKIMYPCETFIESCIKKITEYYFSIIKLTFYNEHEP